MTVVARRSGAAAMSCATARLAFPSGTLTKIVSAAAATSATLFASRRARRQAISRTRRVEAHDLVTGSGDARGHRPAHVPQPDEAEHRRPRSRCHGAGSGVMPSASSTCASEPEGLDTCRHSGVDGDLDQRVAQLVERAPVAQRAAEVRLELLRPVQSGEQAEVVEAALAIGQARPSPHCAPAVLGHELLELDVEAVGRRERPGDVLLAEHALARFEADVEQFLVHGSYSTARCIGSTR